MPDHAIVGGHKTEGDHNIDKATRHHNANEARRLPSVVDLHEIVSIRNAGDGKISIVCMNTRIVEKVYYMESR